MEERVTTLLVDEPHMPVFDKADVTDCREELFETTVLKVLSRLYADCYVFPFKSLARDWRGGWRPDIALVDRRHAYWFVIEVEISTHSLEGHVLPQVLGLRDGEFGDDAVSGLTRHLDIDAERARTLLRYVPRYTAVVANRDDNAWQTRLESENIQFLSISTYMRRPGGPAYLVGGLLRAAQKCVGYGTALPTHACVRTAYSPFWKRGSYTVIEDTGASEWACHIHDKTVWLCKSGVLSFRNHAAVQILCRSDNVLYIRQL